MKTLAALALCAVLAACQTTTVRDERFLRFFDELAFGSETAGSRQQSNTLVRWDVAWTWTVDGSPLFVDVVQARMSRILGIAGLEGERVETGANLRIIQDPGGTTYPVRRDLASCVIRYRHRDGRILSAEIRIAADDRNAISHCLDHEVMHALGFRFHSGVITSVMSPFHSQKTLSRWDIMAIRALMSEGMVAGMGRSEALDRVNATLPDLRIYAERHVQNDW